MGSRNHYVASTLTKPSIIPFADRPNPGQITETLNEHLAPHEAPIAPPSEPRVKLTANTELKKFAYRPMAVHLSEASEILDDRIDEFAALIQEHHRLEDTAFGNAAAKSTREIIAVGRIASDTHEGKMNAKSMVLEMSRRVGAGLRVPLEVQAVQSHGFFSGQIVAVRGINASGEYFSVSEILETPLLPIPSSHPSDIDAINAHLGFSEDDDNPSPSTALNILIAAGPYTADDNLAFEPLQTLCDNAAEAYADVLILIGPLLDIEHPLIATGNIDLPEDSGIDPDKATLNDIFRVLVSAKLRALAQSVPSITIVAIPSVRDAVSKHVSWPQDSLARRELGFPKQARMCTNPVTISLNETVVAISAQDVLYDLRREEVFVGRPKETNILARLPRHVIEQRHFFPVYPPTERRLLPRAGTEEGLATGTPLDTSYGKLGELLSARPDVLVCPSALSPFVKVCQYLPSCLSCLVPASRMPVDQKPPLHEHLYYSVGRTLFCYHGSPIGSCHSPLAHALLSLRERRLIPVALPGRRKRSRHQSRSSLQAPGSRYFRQRSALPAQSQR